MWLLVGNSEMEFKCCFEGVCISQRGARNDVVQF